VSCLRIDDASSIDSLHIGYIPAPPGSRAHKLGMETLLSRDEVGCRRVAGLLKRRLLIAQIRLFLLIVLLCNEARMAEWHPGYSG